MSEPPHAALADRRLDYDVGGFDLADLAATPLAQFRRWYDQAAAAEVPEPNAMLVATANAAGRVSSRTCLLKQADRRGFVFYTNYTSRKAVDLAENPRAALTFAWLPMHRQVIVVGRAERVDRPETEEYFRSRPWGSRIGAWASHQSRPAEGRQALQARYDELAARWPDRGAPDDVPVPPHWGGFVIRPEEIEFWQGRPSRLHDRLVFVAVHASTPTPTPTSTPDLADPAAWRVERREP